MGNHSPSRYLPGKAGRGGKSGGSPLAGGPPAYAELHAHSWFSFLDGTSSPDAMARRAAELGLAGVALTDHQTLAGAVQFALACREHGVRPLFGAEVTVEAHDGRTPSAPHEPEGPFSVDRPHHLVLLAPDLAGWRCLCRILSATGLAGDKGTTTVTFETLAAHGRGLWALTGCLRGEVPAALLAGDGVRARSALGALREVFGDRLLVEVQDHDRLEEAVVSPLLLDLSRKLRIPAVATSDAHYALPEDRTLNDVASCIRHTCTLEGAGGLLRPSGAWHLQSPEAQARRFRDHPELLARTLEVAQDCTFRLDDVDLPLPDMPTPDDAGPAACLRRLTWAGAGERYGELTVEVRRQVEHELGIIERLGMAGYFLLVHDIVRFARSRGILVQGRGSAANSAVCYCLGVTAVDPVGMELLFERFLSEERREPPDIDIDIEHERREEVLQYVYRRWGREHAAMVATVITYHLRSALREVAKVLGFATERTDRISRGLSDHMTRDEVLAELALAGFDPAAQRVGLMVDLAVAMRDMPRHLGIHVGGMIIAGERLDEVASLERARMEDRTVVPWDKDDCAELGLVKMDLLGLGMLTMISRALKLIERHTGRRVDLATLGHGDGRVYDLLCAADTVGVFQVESRAQMATLPRMRPRRFYDLVVEVALIRPGPIQGDMVHPYLRRRRGEEEITCIHPLLEPALRRTLGIPLFQEQGMRVAVLAAGFSNAEADELRRAMGHKRSSQKMEAMRGRLLAGMAANRIDQATAERIYQQLAGFADYGFPESHAASFALLVYVSAWLKVYHPWAFFAALLDSQPMGFYRVGTLVADARRHGVPVRGVDLTRSGFETRIEPVEPGEREAVARRPAALVDPSPFALRLGYGLVDGIGEEKGRGLEAASPFTSLHDLVRRSGLPDELLLRLARVGAADPLSATRREALWRLAELARRPAGLFDLLGEDCHRPRSAPVPAPTAAGESLRERVAWEYDTLGFGLSAHPMTLIRPRLDARRVLPAEALADVPDGTVVTVAGEAIVKQKPPTARGVVFVSLEDETGIANVVLRPAVYARHRRAVLDHNFFMIEGTVERRHEAVNLMAHRLGPLGVISSRRRPRRMYTGIG